jgi:hypothetical protein
MVKHIFIEAESATEKRTAVSPDDRNACVVP